MGKQQQQKQQQGLLANRQKEGIKGSQARDKDTVKCEERANKR